MECEDAKITGSARIVSYLHCNSGTICARNQQETVSVNKHVIIFVSSALRQSCSHCFCSLCWESTADFSEHQSCMNCSAESQQLTFLDVFYKLILQSAGGGYQYFLSV